MGNDTHKHTDTYAPNIQRFKISISIPLVFSYFGHCLWNLSAGVKARYSEGCEVLPCWMLRSEGDWMTLKVRSCCLLFLFSFIPLPLSHLQKWKFLFPKTSLRTQEETCPFCPLKVLAWWVSCLRPRGGYKNSIGVSRPYAAPSTRLHLLAKPSVPCHSPFLSILRIKALVIQMWRKAPISHKLFLT